MTVARFTPEDVAHLLGIDGEIVGVEWDAGAHEIRFTVDAVGP